MKFNYIHMMYKINIFQLILLEGIQKDYLDLQNKYTSVSDESMELSVKVNQNSIMSNEEKQVLNLYLQSLLDKISDSNNQIDILKQQNTILEGNITVLNKKIEALEKDKLENTMEIEVNTIKNPIKTSISLNKYS